MKGHHYTKLGVHKKVHKALGLSQPNQSAQDLWYAAGVAGTAMGAYHGYKRDQGSIGWTFGWALFGGLLPVIAIPVMLAQGFGDPAPPY